jgi:hypothetical protein
MERIKISLFLKQTEQSKKEEKEIPHCSERPARSASFHLASEASN